MRFNPIQGGTGLRIWQETAVVWNRGGAGIVVGDLLMFDMQDTDAGTTTTLDENAEGYHLSNVILPATAGLGGLAGAATTFGLGFWFGVVVDLMGNAGADDKKLKVCVRGRLKAKTNNSAILFGSPLVGSNGVKTLKLFDAAAPGNKILAIAQQANASTAGSYTVLFNGIEGWGQPVAS